MYIAPNSDVRILQNIRVDPEYDNTIYFGNENAQRTYFMGKTKHTLTEQYYVRIEDGIIKVEIPIGSLVDCNYMMFKNTSFENKWFYAFIDKVEYVNNVTTRVHFTIDVMQTWYFDYDLAYSLVEREHVRDDTLGLNVIPEPFEINDFVYQDFNELTKSSYNNISLDELAIIVAYAKNAQPLGHVDPYNVYDNILQGVDLYAIECSTNGAKTLATLFDDNASTIDNIVDIYVVPKYALPSGTILMTGNISLSDNYIIPSQSVGKASTVTFDKIMSGDAFIDPKSPNYTPINNKLYTYPYCMLEISTPNGEKATYAFEDFKRYDSQLNPDTQIHFAIKATLTTPVQLSCYPINYRRFISGQSVEALNEPPMSIATYPKVAYSSDAFAAWSAQNSVPVMIDTMMSAGTGAISGAMVGGGVGAGVGALASLTESGMKVASDMYRVSQSSDHTRGCINNGSVLHAHGIYTFYRSVKHISNEYAKMVDDYFSLFGYAVNELKMPSRSNRKHWTYVKTKSCNFGRRELPSDELAQIKSIYDRGIRFWNDGDKIGDYVTYLSDNTPV